MAEDLTIVKGTKEEQYTALLPQVKGLLEGEPDLVANLDLAGKALAIAVNREVVPRQAWAARQLQPRDRVDIVRAIGGG